MHLPNSRNFMPALLYHGSIEIVENDQILWSNLFYNRSARHECDTNEPRAKRVRYERQG